MDKQLYARAKSEFTVLAPLTLEEREKRLAQLRQTDSPLADAVEALISFDADQTIGIGSKLGTYTLTALLGRGGQAEVWLARDRNTGREVAIKTLRPDKAHAALAVERFQREAAILARLQHDNICIAYQVSSAPTPYIAMQLIPGHSLAEEIRRGRRATASGTTASVTRTEPLPSPGKTSIGDQGSSARSSSGQTLQRWVRLIPDQAIRPPSARFGVVSARYRLVVASWRWRSELELLDGSA